MAAASVSTSIAAKLLYKMNPYKYKEYCATINERDSVSISFYKASKWVNYFALDTSMTFRNGKVNKDHVYEYFGRFNGVSAKTVRKNLLAYVSGNMDFVNKRSSVCLSMRSMDLDTWIENINDGKPCDELALLTLSGMYQCHSLVVTKNKSWCTIESPTPMNLLQAMSACTVRLIYLGDLNFGVLKWKPQVPKPVAAKPNNDEVKSVEEYTINEQQAMLKKLAVVKPTPVETATREQPCTSSSLLVPEKEDLQLQMPPSITPSPKKDIPTKLTVTYTDDNTKFYVGTTPASPKQESLVETVSPDSYPWKKKLCVSIRRLSDFEISYWSGGFNQDNDEHPSKMEASPEKDTMVLKQETDLDEGLPPTSDIGHIRFHLKKEPKADVKRSTSPDDQTTEKLLAHAKSLIERVSTALGTSDELKTKSDTAVQ